MNFEDFKRMAIISIEEICRDVYNDNRDSIKIKKESVVVKNLVNIFNVTLKLSNDKGFQAMSLRDLSRETGLSMGALYSYFSSKDELLDIIQSQGRRITTKILMEQISQGDNPRHKLHIAIRTHIYLSEVMQKWFFFAFMEVKNFNKEEHKKAIKSELFTEKFFVDILEEGNREHIFSVSNCELTASIIKAILQDWYLKHWKYTRRNISIDEYAEFVIDFVESYIISDK